MIALLLALAVDTVVPCRNADGQVVYCADPSAVSGPLVTIADPNQIVIGYDDGPPLSPAAPITVALADRMADHAFRIGSGIALNSFTTAWGIEHEGLVEKNRVGFSPEARGAVKLGIAIGALTSCWRLEKDGHRRAAGIVSRTVQVLQYAAAAWDVYQISTHRRVR